MELMKFLLPRNSSRQGFRLCLEVPKEVLFATDADMSLPRFTF